jgi:hypothetical protein
MLGAGEAVGLELGAQPVYVGKDLSAQRPAGRPGRGIGTQQVRELVLLLVRLG